MFQRGVKIMLKTRTIIAIVGNGTDGTENSATNTWELHDVFTPTLYPRRFSHRNAAVLQANGSATASPARPAS